MGMFDKPKRRKFADGWKITKELMNPSDNSPIIDKSRHEATHTSKVSESTIQSEIIKHLLMEQALGRLVFQRTNNQPTFQVEEVLPDGRLIGRYRSMSTGQRKGWPDIIALQDGKFIGMEVKTGQGRMSKDQKEWERDITQHGGLYYIARSVDGCKSALEDAHSS